MSKMDFTEPEHVSMLQDWIKMQTTRPPRKIPIKVGETLYCYYKPRMKACCWNCIHPQCIHSNSWNARKLPYAKIESCDKHTNYFGEAKAIEIIHRWATWDSTQGRSPDWKKNRFDIRLCDLGDGERHAWAVADGFRDFNEADEWFTEKYSKKGVDGSDWIHWDWDVIRFKPGWIARQVA